MSFSELCLELCLCPLLSLPSVTHTHTQVVRDAVKATRRSVKQAFNRLEVQVLRLDMKKIHMMESGVRGDEGEEGVRRKRRPRPPLPPVRGKR